MTDTNTLVPQSAFLTKGIGRHKEMLTSYELALRDAQIAEYNLVTVSSIFPAHCKLVAVAKGVRRLRAGQIVFLVQARAQTNEPSRLATASIGLAIPKDPNHYGYVSEHHAFGMPKIQAGDYAEDLAASMLATVLGVPFDPEEAWDERREQWKLSGEIVRTTNISCTAKVATDGKWVTVVSALVFCG
ncbi:MAG: pyruvoyl-dependent arginine decarboxylase [Gemmatimonadetes bacterium]|nr:pyruvoyl-dependent arginine decarboxylase [Gemmatimonadota bacterium]MCH8934264.1 pyruvoyl-dependent arginine decarboxylase [Gemmatimonadota bacterium]